MKRFINLLLIATLLISFSFSASATEINETVNTIYYEDGSYLTITVTQYHTRTSNSVSGYKRYDYTEANGNLAWYSILAGTFTCDGTTAVCTTSSVTSRVNASNWYEVSKTAAKNGSTANGTVTMGRTVLGITVAKETYNMTLTCSPNGTLS